MLNALDEYIIHLSILYLLTSLNLKPYSKVHVNLSKNFTMNIAYYYYDIYKSLMWMDQKI
jgi:hypothetical protein